MSLLPLSTMEHHIQRVWGDRVSVFDGPGSAFVYGTNSSVDTSGETVWQTGGFETYPTSNTITTIQSSSASDTMDVLVDGVTQTDVDRFVNVQQTVTLNGTTAVTLPTPMFRAEYARQLSPTPNVGTITVTGSDGTHLTIVAGDTDSSKCAITVPTDHYLFLTVIGATLFGGNNADTAFSVEVRSFGEAWRPGFHLSSRGSGTSAPETYFDPPAIIQPNTDLRFDAYPQANGISVRAGMFGVWARIMNDPGVAQSQSDPLALIRH